MGVGIGLQQYLKMSRKYSLKILLLECDIAKF